MDKEKQEVELNGVIGARRSCPDLWTDSEGFMSFMTGGLVTLSEDRL